MAGSGAVEEASAAAEEGSRAGRHHHEVGEVAGALWV